MRSFKPLVAALFALMLLTASCGDSGSIEVDQARYRLARSDLAAGFMEITNSTGTTVTLQSASSSAVGRIELHESVQASDGTFAMEARPDGFEIADGDSIVLAPGGKHLMLFDPPTEGDVEIELDFGDQVVVIDAVFDAEASANLSDTDEHGMSDDDDHDMDQDDHSDHDMDDDAMDQSDASDS